jgi:hypothetical protein
MKSLYLLLIPLTLSFSQIKFDDYFLDKSLRFDYYETGNQDESIFSFDELIEEPYWGGSKTNLIDTLEYGNYFFKILDSEEDMVIYSRGFSHLFQEWQTTKEARITSKSFGGSLVFPFPKKNSELLLFKRDEDNEWEEVFRYAIKADNYFIKKERRHAYDNFIVHEGGHYSNCYDIVLLPEGYTESEMSQFKKDCGNFAKVLFDFAPFDELKQSINIWGVDAPSAESGTDIPADGEWKSTILNSNFYTFDSERYLMTPDYKTVKDIAANAPYDQIVILVNTEKYGGGAVYNYYSTFSARHPLADRIIIHELGHGIAGLADEYYTSDVAYLNFYPTDVEPWEANITTLVDFESKWMNLLDPDTPVPTPAVNGYSDKIGVFEGAGYAEKGVYRSSKNSIMLNLDSDSFNLVSRTALKKVILMSTN